MKLSHLTLVLGSLLSFAAHAADGELKMTGPDAGVAQYNDHCANGRNNGEAVRKQFVEKMLANPESQLAKTVAGLSTFEDDFQLTKGVLTPWVQSFHLRSGCGTNNNSYSAIVQSYDTMSNSHVTVSKFLVTINDDDEVGTRTLSLKSIQPLSIREEE